MFDKPDNVSWMDYLKMKAGNTLNSGTPSKIIQTALKTNPITRNLYNAGSAIQTAIAPGLNPITRDYGVGENLQKNITFSSGGTPQQTDQQTQVASSGGDLFYPTSAVYDGSSGGGTGGTGDTGSGDPSNPSSIDEMLRRQWERSMGEISSWLDRAKGVRDEVKGLIANKRNRYGELKTEGDIQISDTFEGEKGNARRTFNDLTSTEGNRARALGLGGSVTDYAANRRAESLGRQLGNINTVKSSNTRENQRLYDDRLNQADAWDMQNERDYGDALRTAQTAQNSAYNTQESQLQSWIDSIIANKNALDVAKGNISASTANPYNVSSEGLQNVLNEIIAGSGSTKTGDQNVNLKYDPRLIAQLYKNSG